MKTLQKKLAASLYRMMLAPGAKLIHPTTGRSLTSRHPAWSVLPAVDKQFSPLARELRERSALPAGAGVIGPHQSWLTEAGLRSLMSPTTQRALSHGMIQVRRLDDARPDIDVIGDNGFAKFISPWRSTEQRLEHFRQHVAGQQTGRGGAKDFKPFATAQHYNEYIGDMLRQWRRGKLFEELDGGRKATGLVDRTGKNLIAVDDAGALMSAYKPMIPKRIQATPTTRKQLFETLGQPVRVK